MTSRDFCFWFRGYLEIAAAKDPSKTVEFTAAQLETVDKHLKMVFKHEIDPSFPDQETLNSIHNSNPGGPVLRC